MKKLVLLVSVLSVGFAAMGFPIPGLSGTGNAMISAKNRVGQQGSMNNLRQIFTGITMYISAHDDMLPTDFSALSTYVGGGRIFVADFDKKSKAASGNVIKPENTSFAYVGNLGRIDALKEPAATPVAFEKPWLLPASQRAVMVLFADGHVDSVQLAASTPRSCSGVISQLSKKISDRALKNKLSQNAAKEDRSKK